MFLTKCKRSPFYQIVYEVEGKRTTVSTKTKDLNEVKKFLASFIIPYRKNNVVFELNNSIMLSKFRNEYINYLSQSKSKAYIERLIKHAFKFLIEISEAELIEILNHTPSQLMKNIFAFAFYTGMRLGEILNTQWDWIDKKQNLIIIKNSESFTTKSKKERIIPIHQKVKKILTQQAINNTSLYIFINGSINNLNSEYVSKQFKKALRSAKLNDDIHFHSLRHSFASNLVQRGVNLYVVKELLGHEDIKTTQVYSHLTQSSLSNAVLLL